MTNFSIIFFQRNLLIIFHNRFFFYYLTFYFNLQILRIKLLSDIKKATKKLSNFKEKLFKTWNTIIDNEIGNIKRLLKPKKNYFSGCISIWIFPGVCFSIRISMTFLHIIFSSRWLRIKKAQFPPWLHAHKTHQQIWTMDGDKGGGMDFLC